VVTLCLLFKKQEKKGRKKKGKKDKDKMKSKDHLMPPTAYLRLVYEPFMQVLSSHEASLQPVRKIRERK
jgi:hypothetical protein